MQRFLEMQAIALFDQGFFESKIKPPLAGDKQFCCGQIKLGF
jgi:hypothetical protein